MKKPNLKNIPKDAPSSVIHSTMELWASKQRKGNLIITATFPDGSKMQEVIVPCTKEIEYKTKDGEQWTVSVDVAKYADSVYTNDESKTPKQFVAALIAWLNVPGVVVGHYIED